MKFNSHCDIIYFVNRLSGVGNNKFMKKSLKLFALSIVSLMTFGALLNVNLEKNYKPGQYVPEQNSYYAGKIQNEAGHIKAHKFITPSDPNLSTQKNYSHGTNMIGDIESTWDAYTGKGTTIAIIDDGFDRNHPEYVRSDGTSAILSASRYYYTDDDDDKVYFDEYSSDPSCIEEDWEYDEYEETYLWATHGTATSTTAAAPMNGRGGVGIAPDADILALKIDMSFGAIDYAIKYAVNCGVDVINMSIGAFADFDFYDGFGVNQNDSDGGRYNAASYSWIATYLNSACQQAYNAGVIVVAAAGNEATYHKSYPACNSHVIGVGGLEENEERTLAAFTNYVDSSQTGEINVDILAPGYVYTAEKSGTQSSPTHVYNDTQGTSFSSPIVAGAACLWKQKNPNGTPSEFLSELQSTASDIGYYADKYVPVNLYGNKYTKQGPSNISQGRLNISNLLDINEPYISLVQSSVDVYKGGTRTVEIKTSNGTVTFSSGNTSIATVTNAGIVTGVAAGSTTITATATKNGHTATATIPVTVQNAIACNSMTISPTEAEISVGETYAIEPTITTVPANATRIFMYISDDESVATVDFETGVVTGVGEGDTSITIMALEGDGEATLDVHVEGALITSWDRVETTSGLSSGDEIILGYNASKVSGTLSGSYLQALDATFDSATKITTLPSGTESFVVGTSGNYYTLQQTSNNQYLGYNAKNLNEGTAPTNWSISISSGIASITGGDYPLMYNTGSPRWKTYDSNFAGGDYSIYKKTTGSSSVPTVTSVTVSPSTLSLDVNGTKTGNLSATVNGTHSPAQTVTWGTSDSSVATVSNGTVTAVSAGTATITATSTVDTTKSGTCTVTVSDSSVHVTSVALNKNSTSIEVGSKETLTATVSPNNATNKNVTWSSNKTSVATVSSNGEVTAVSAGTATITVTTVDGSHTATCSVTVTDSQHQTLIITRDSFATAGGYAWYDWTSGTVSGKAELYTTTTTSMQFNKSKGDKVAAIFNTTAIPGSITKIEATSAQATIRSWTAYITSTACSASGATLTFGSNKTTVGSATPAIDTSTSFGTSSSGYSYFCLQENDASASYLSEIKITYTPKSLSSISVKTAPTKLTYDAGECFDPTGLVITANYSDNSTADISYASSSSNFSFSPNLTTALTTSNDKVTISYGGKSCDQAITVNSVKSLSSITISGQTTSFVEGDTFSFGGTVTAHYDDNSTENVTTSATFSGYNMTTVGSHTVTVSYEYRNVTKTTTYTITVSQGTVSSISLSGQTTTYTRNAAFTFDGTCTATFANGYQKVVTPTSVTSPDMTTAGTKTVTVSFSYNGRTVSASYQITVNAYRDVWETVTTYPYSTITWPSSVTPTITGDLTNVTVTRGGKTTYESSSLRLGTGDGGGNITIQSSDQIVKVEVTAKYYSSNYSSAVLKVDGQSVTPLSASYQTYTVTLDSAKTSFQIKTDNSSNRVNIQQVRIYKVSSTTTNIGQNDDCVGLETFITTYMHMDYVENLGYCKDSEHHYYSSAKAAFNALNDHQRTLFTTNSAYASEWSRLSAWASFNGDSLNSSNQLGSAPKAISTVLDENTNNIGLIIIISALGLSSISGYFFLRKKKEN